MARLFNGSTQYMTLAATPITAVPLTVAGWFYPTSATANYDLIFIRDAAGGAGQNYFGIYLSPASDSKVGAAVSAAAAENIASTTTTYSANTWNHAAASFTSATLRTAYLNGGGKATNTTNRTPTTIASITVGGFFTSSLFSAMNGRIAEVCVYDVVLTDDEIFSLSRGVSPLRVRPQNLRCYWPLYGNGSPEPNYSRNTTDYSLTLQAAPTQIDHPPVQRPFGRVTASSIRAALVAAKAMPVFHHALRTWRRGI